VYKLLDMLLLMPTQLMTTRRMMMEAAVEVEVTVEAAVETTDTAKAIGKSCAVVSLWSLYSVVLVGCVPLVAFAAILLHFVPFTHMSFPACFIGSFGTSGQLTGAITATSMWRWAKIPVEFSTT